MGAVYRYLLCVTIVLTVVSLAKSDQASPDDLISDPNYRAGYQNAIYDLYTALLHNEPVFSPKLKKGIDLGLGRFNSGGRAGSSFLALNSARFAGGPGRK